MTKEQFINILDYCEELYLEDENNQKAFDLYIDSITDKEYAPALNNKLDIALKMIGMISKLEQEFVYYFYEAKNMKEATCTYKDKEYNLKDKNEFIRWINDIYFTI